MWLFRGAKESSEFSSRSTAEQVTEGIDGTGLTAIVTGASSGIGAETARVLALRGVHVVLAVRNVDAGNRVREDIIKELRPLANITVMELDLSSMVSVRNFASEYISSGFVLNILILLNRVTDNGLTLDHTLLGSNNAGICGAPFTLSSDNIELHFATNHIGHFLLTNLLLETMKRTARETKREGRIINVSSIAHHQLFRSEGIRFDRINVQTSYNCFYAYGQSKLANVLHANELARRLKAEGVVEITVNSLHPGSISTNIMRNRSNLLQGVKTVLKFLTAFLRKDIPQGAATQCYMALHPRVKGISGEYFADCNKAKMGAYAADPELAKKLWDFSLSLTNST